MKRQTPKPLHRRLNVPLWIADLMTSDEVDHAEVSLRNRKEAHSWITRFKYDSSKANQAVGYNAEFWTQHEKLTRSSNSLKGLRAVLRLRYSLTFEQGLYEASKTNTWGRMRTGMHGRGRGRYLKKGTLLMWIERDEFGENWFMNLNDNKTIIAIKGAALQNVIPVPPEEDEK